MEGIHGQQRDDLIGKVNLNIGVVARDAARERNRS
jgi:hypothetical protein